MVPILSNSNICMHVCEPVMYYATLLSPVADAATVIDNFIQHDVMKAQYYDSDKPN